MDSLLAVNGIENTSDEFRRRVIAMANRLQASPNYLMAVMSFETGGTFRADVRNPDSHAVGLIQFTKGAAEQLGTTRDALAAMTPEDQLAYVEKYLKPATGAFHTVSDHYLAVFAPVGMGKSQDFVLYDADIHGDKYWMNAALDVNDDGGITVREATRPVQSILDNASGFVDVPPAPTPAETKSSGAGGILGFLLFILGIARYKRHASTARKL